MPKHVKGRLKKGDPILVLHDGTVIMQAYSINAILLNLTKDDPMRVIYESCDPKPLKVKWQTFNHPDGDIGETMMRGTLYIDGDVYYLVSLHIPEQGEGSDG